MRVTTHSSAGSAGARTAALHGSTTVERDFSSSPEEVFNAFADPSVRGRWFKIPAEPDTRYHELDFRVGGGERAGGTFAPMDNPERVEYESRFFDIVPAERIVFGYRLTLNGQTRTVSLVTAELAAAGDGTLLRYTEQYTLVNNDGDGSADAAHVEGSVKLLLNGLSWVVDGPGRAA
jgi:uncharacterized protein YndB with AHSA1/START domain